MTFDVGNFYGCKMAFASVQNKDCWLWVLARTAFMGCNKDISNE